MPRGGKRKGAGRPVLVGATKSLSLRLSPDLRKRLDKWAKAQPDKPGSSEAARRLLEKAMSAENS